MDTENQSSEIRSASTRKDFLLHAMQVDQQRETATHLTTAELAQTAAATAPKVDHRIQQYTDSMVTAASNPRTTRTIFSTVNRAQRTQKDELVGAGADVIAGSLPYMDGAAEDPFTEKRVIQETSSVPQESARGMSDNLTRYDTTQQILELTGEREQHPEITHLNVGDGGLIIDDDGLFEVCLDDDDNLDTPVDRSLNLGQPTSATAGGVARSDHSHVGIRQKIRQAYTSPRNRLLKLVSPKRSSHLHGEVSILCDKSIIYSDVSETVSISPSLKALNPSAQLSSSGCISPDTIAVEMLSGNVDSPNVDDRKTYPSSAEGRETPSASSSKSFGRLSWMFGARPQPRRVRSRSNVRRYTAPVISLHDITDDSKSSGTLISMKEMTAGGKIYTTHCNPALDFEASQRDRKPRPAGEDFDDLRKRSTSNISLSRPATSAVMATVRHVAHAVRNTRDKLHSQFMSAVVCGVLGETPSTRHFLRRYLNRYTREGTCSV